MFCKFDCNKKFRTVLTLGDKRKKRNDFLHSPLPKKKIEYNS